VQRPSVGRIVHYVSHDTFGGEYPATCRAAIITAVDDYQYPRMSEDGRHMGHISLCVFNQDGVFFDLSVLYDAGAHKGGTWHWPEHVD
jgi:hypothetical protein